ncbi:DHS-like NAD/FAD-binding domain-containing protein [Rickenella mellea]|uniref:DHS-like NAD/FAD-binding domain-containing protein n=1 Tax=Rickenella mellea TaxID=50990 RepID=A0A4Y7PE83_9AGAM|nr:DHS-like NAD/FAD-binding domain-containing protein [Rickenella mellea]
MDKLVVHQLQHSKCPYLPYRDLLMRLRGCTKVLIVTGAGISTAAGIPAFRTPDGVFTVNGVHLFDANAHSDPTVRKNYCVVVEKIFFESQKASNPPTPAHGLLAIMEKAGSLARAYTQNIDDLESHVGLQGWIQSSSSGEGLKSTSDGVNLVHLHGNVNIMKCSKCCLWERSTNHLITEWASGNPRECLKCCLLPSLSGKRSPGVLSPQIVLYGGVQLPDSDRIAQWIKEDVKRGPDLLIVMGTSMEIQSVQETVEIFSLAVHERGGLVVWVNHLAAPNVFSRRHVFDFFVEGDVQSFCEDLALLIIS